jgi:hypothetical protein
MLVSSPLLGFERDGDGVGFAFLATVGWRIHHESATKGALATVTDGSRGRLHGAVVQRR